MPDKKLTDNEIVKALECCANNPNDCVCYESKCPLFGQKCIDILSKNALDLINRLQAENERLKENLNIELENYATEYDYKIKVEAYKEFAERLKENSIATFSWNGVVLVEEIDNLLKELVGDE